MAEPGDAMTAGEVCKLLAATAAMGRGGRYADAAGVVRGLVAEAERLAAGLERLAADRDALAAENARFREALGHIASGPPNGNHAVERAAAALAGGEGVA